MALPADALAEGCLSLAAPGDDARSVCTAFLVRVINAS